MASTCLGSSATAPDVDRTGLANLGNVLRHEDQRVDPVHLWTLLSDSLVPLSAALGRQEERSPRSCAT